MHEHPDREHDIDAGDARLRELLDDLKHADPPPDGLVRDIMSEVRATSPIAVVRSTGGTVGMGKKVMLGLAAAAAIVVAVMAAKGWPPSGAGTEGAIGAAKRHQAQQMSAADVKLGDQSAQEFL